MLVFYLKILFRPSDFYQTNYLNIYQTFTRLHGRTLAVHERSEVIFFDPSRDVAVATNAVGTIDPHSNLVVRMTFARAAPPAYDNKGSCYAGRKQQIT